MAAAGLQGVTADEIAADNISRQKLDEANLRYNADINSWEANEAAKYENYQYQEQARQSRTAGKNAKKSGKTQAFTTLLGTAASVAGQAGGAFTPKSTPKFKYAGTGSYVKKY